MFNEKIVNKENVAMCAVSASISMFAAAVMAFGFVGSSFIA